MGLLERKFTAYSGTILENFTDLAFAEGEQVFFSKTNGRFDYPQGVYYTSKIHEACYYAVRQIPYIRLNQWEQTKPLPFLSDFLEGKPPPIPVILCGELPIIRRFPFMEHYVQAFPVSSVLVPIEGADFHDARKSRFDPDLISLFQPVDLRELLAASLSKKPV